MDIFSIALSGMQAAQTQMNVAAQNVANLDTPGYQPARADLVDLSGGGVAVSHISQTSPTDPKTADPAEGSNVDLATEMVNMTRASLLYSANAAVIKIGQKTTGALLDMFDQENQK